MASLALTAMAQKKAASLAPENDAARLEQCRNGVAASPEQCAGANWTTGNTGSSNSHWRERDFIAYRMIFTGLSAGTNVVVIGYDRIHSGKNAIDYLGSFDATETNADPCSDITGIGYTCTSATPTDEEPTPHEPLLDSHVPPIPQIAGDFSFFGATFNSLPVFVPCGVADETLVRCVRIEFTPLAGVTNPVLAWGGHIAWRGEWGPGQSAGGISGSPYHMRLEELNGQGGNQDRSLSAQGIVGPGSLRVIKEVITNPVGTSSTVQFFFNANRAFTPLNFFLVDDDGGTGVDFKLSDSILTYDGTANVITVTEDITQFPVNQNWSLGGITCVESVSNTGTTINVGLATATVTVDPEEVVTCTFRNQQLTPSAAQVSISGRTIDSFGNGIGGARIVITNAANGSTWSGVTNSFGYYTIEGLDVGEFYVITASHKRFTFADNTRTISVNDSVTGMDFVANP